MGKKKQLRALKLKLCEAVLGILAVAGLGYAYWQSPWRPITRDAVLALGAHALAGKPIPVAPDYSGGIALDEDVAYGIITNSLWLTRAMFRVVPFMSYEGIIENPNYPPGVFFVPFPRDGSFHVAGRAVLQYGYLLINERIVTDPRWNDARDLLEVLTHEIIHFQFGVFAPDVTSGDSWGVQSARLESATSAATVEVLAAMCNYGDQLACKAFWMDIESLARYSLAFRLRRWPGVYDAFANLFLRDADAERASRKSSRYWAGAEDVRMDIVLKYGVDPYEYHLLPALTDGKQMDTGNSDGFGHRLSLKFDDAFDLLGPGWVLWLQIMTP